MGPACRGAWRVRARGGRPPGPAGDPVPTQRTINAPRTFRVHGVRTWIRLRISSVTLRPPTGYPLSYEALCYGCVGDGDSVSVRRAFAASMILMSHGGWCSAAILLCCRA